MTTSFVLQFDQRQIPRLADRYLDPREDRVVDEISPAVRERGYYTRSEFVEVCRWKTPRSKPLVARNSETDVVETTRQALSAESEEVRIGALRALSGVDYPTASVLLHFGHQDRYPILDYRALQALGIDRRTGYTFRFWTAYVDACRRIDDETGFGMRTVDRALWQWSKEQEGTSSSAR